MTIPTPQGATVPAREILPAMLRGLRQRCPACGKGAIYGKYLKVAQACPACGEALHHQRADDAPPYFTMLIVGHIVIGALLHVETTYHPELWVHLSLWGPATLGLSLFLLPRIKGALIGLQWAARMHGFGRTSPDPALPAAWSQARSQAGQTLHD
jgi:uncharacterized protein (DUF983 family)